MMKQIALLLCLCIAGIANAGNKSKKTGIRALTFYGVNFSLAKVYAANESAQEFKHAFRGINELFQREPQKYDIAKAFNVENTTTSLSETLAQINRIDASGLFTQSDNYALTREEVAAFIQKFNTGNDKGYGAIMMAGLLNKGKCTATYTVVVFNVETKEIEYQYQITSKAKGFGLRNFWAGSVYATLKQIKKM